MKIGIETVFKKEDSEVLCREIVEGKAIQEKCLKFIIFSICASALYGFTMGLNHSVAQGLSSAIKVFLLFILTLTISLPTLHFTGLLFGSSIKFSQTLCVLLAGTALTCVLLAAFAPISIFFLLSGSRYEFLLLMHVFIFACCGAAGLFSVKRNMGTIAALLHKDEVPETPEPASQKEATPSLSPYTYAPIKERGTTGTLLRIWFLVYMFIGAQTAYLLSPFVGKATQFVLITSEKGDFFSYIIQTLRSLP